MLITEIDITNFRSIARLHLKELGPAAVFYGRNGSGKSNIIAAVAAGVRLIRSLAPACPSTAANASGVGGVLQPGDFRLPGDGSCSIGVVIEASAGDPVLLLDDMPITRLSFRVAAQLRADRTPVAWISSLTGRAAGSDVNLIDVLRAEQHAIPTNWPIAREADTSRQRERFAAVINAIQSFMASRLDGWAYRVVNDLRHLGRTESNARKLGDVAAMLAAGDLKGAFAAAHQHPTPEVRDRFSQLRRLLRDEPLSLPEFDPIRLPDGDVDVQTRIPGGGAVSIDFSGLGIQQLFYIVASIALAPAGCVAIEEPEAHLHAPTSGRALRQLLSRMLEPDDPLVSQLFVATHSNLFDLDRSGYYHVELVDGSTRVHRRRDLVTIDRDHLWEPGPARHALEDAIRVLPPDTVVAHQPDGTPVAATQMIESLLADDDLARQFCEDVVGAAVRAVRVRAKSAS